MDSKQKQRIVGIIFLVILAVVAIPAFLKHSRGNAISSDSAEQQMAQEQNQVFPNEAVPPEANQQPLATDQQPPSNAVSNPNPVPTMPAPPSDGSMMQEESAEPMPSEAQAIPSQPSFNPPNQAALPATPPTPPTQQVITAPLVSAPTSASPESVSSESIKKPTVLKKTSKIEHHVEKTDWTIRLAIFSVRANADKLLSDLKKHGYHGSVEEINTYKGMTYKVTLKTKSSRPDANKLATKLNNLFHIHVIVGKTH